MPTGKLEVAPTRFAGSAGSGSGSAAGPTRGSRGYARNEGRASYRTEHDGGAVPLKVRSAMASFRSNKRLLLARVIRKVAGPLA